MSAPQPVRAAAFVNAIGVNTHLGYEDNTAAKVIADMAYLGLNHVRDHALGLNTPQWQAGMVGQVAAAGIKFDWLTGGGVASTMAALDTFLAAHPGSVAAIEGPNEINNFPFTYAGLTGVAAAQSYQTALWNAVESDPLTAMTPVLNFTGGAPAAGAASAANLHVYPTAGAQPLATLSAAFAAAGRQMSNAPVYFTEAGYSSLPGPHGGVTGVDPATQAKLILNLIMDAAKLGARATYLYDLIDDGPDPAGAYGPNHFGLFTVSGQAKPSAVAIHNLTAILADTGAATESFNVTPLRYTISGLPASGSSLVIEKSSGEYDICLWAEPTVWKVAAQVAAAKQTVTVAFASPATSIRVYDPLVSADPVAPVSMQKAAIGASAVSVAVADHPVIIQVSNFVQSMAAAGAIGSASPLAMTAASAAPAPQLFKP